MQITYRVPISSTGCENLDYFGVRVIRDARAFGAGYERGEGGAWDMNCYVFGS